VLLLLELLQATTDYYYELLLWTSELILDWLLLLNATVNSYYWLLLSAAITTSPSFYYLLLLTAISGCSVTASCYYPLYYQLLNFPTSCYYRLYYYKLLLLALLLWAATKGCYYYALRLCYYQLPLLATTAHPYRLLPPSPTKCYYATLLWTALTNLYYHLILLPISPYKWNLPPSLLECQECRKVTTCGCFTIDLHQMQEVQQMLMPTWHISYLTKTLKSTMQVSPATS